MYSVEPPLCDRSITPLTLYFKIRLTKQTGRVMKQRFFLSIHGVADGNFVFMRNRRTKYFVIIQNNITMESREYFGISDSA